MVLHICNRCGYQTNRKQNLKKHLSRKFKCKIIMNKLQSSKKVTQNDYKNMNKINKISQKSPKSNPKVTQNDYKKYKCSYCDKLYKYKQGKWRHEQNCKFRNSETKDNIINELLKQNDKKNELIENLIKKIGNNKVNNYNSNNKTVNIIINNYGEENIEFIDEKMIKKLIKKPGSAIQKLLKIIHFNEKYPENQNLKITNIHDPYIHVYDKGWKIKKKGQVIDEIIVDKFDIIHSNLDSEDEITENYKNKIEQKIIDKKKNKSLCDQVVSTIINESKNYNVKKNI